MNTLPPKVLTELVGTFFLTLSVSLAVTHAGSAAPIAVGAVLIALVYMGGAISGAQYNPAVTLSVWLTKNMPGRDVGPFIAAQGVGALAGAGVGVWLTGRHPAPVPAARIADAGAGATHHGLSSLLPALAVEALFTFLLVLVILNVACSRRTAGNPYFGVAIGLTIMGAAFVGGPISGGAFNPAVGFGLCAIDAAQGGGSLGHAWIYLVGPVVGGMLAGAVFRAQQREA